MRDAMVEQKRGRESGGIWVMVKLTQQKQKAIIRGDDLLLGSVPTQD